MNENAATDDSEPEEPESVPASPLLHGKILLWMVLLPGLAILLGVPTIGALNKSFSDVVRYEILRNVVNLLGLVLQLCMLSMGLGIFILIAGYFQGIGPKGLVHPPADQRNPPEGLS